MINIIDFQKTLVSIKLNGLIISDPINILYLTSFKGVSLTEREATLVFNPQPTLITSRLYQNEAKSIRTKNLSVRIVDDRIQWDKTIKSLLKSCKKIGFETLDLRVSEYEHYKKLLTPNKLIPTKSLTEDLRLYKSSVELQNILKAQIISQKAFEQVIKTIKIGQAESEIADMLAKIMKNLGADGLAFDSIVASGKNSALPHYLTGYKKIRKGEVLLLDFGAKYKGYCADLSRTVFLGNASDEQKNIYNLVQKAQDQAISDIKSGVKAKNIFSSAYKIFQDKKIEKYFIHGLGHGIGLEVHESPSISKKSKDTLANKMVFSVEPGLYFPAWGGVRIEDLVTIINGKAKIIGRHSEHIEIK